MTGSYYPRQERHTGGACPTILTKNEVRSPRGTSCGELLRNGNPITINSDEVPTWYCARGHQYVLTPAGGLRLLPAANTSIVPKPKPKPPKRTTPPPDTEPYLTPQVCVVCDQPARRFITDGPDLGKTWPCRHEGIKPRED